MSFWIKIAEFVLSAPPCGIIWSNEGGVFQRGGKFKRELPPGFYWKWPFYDSIKKIPTKEQWVNLPNQSLTTVDSKSLAVSGAVCYEIDGYKKAILENFDYDTNIQNLSMVTIASYVCSSKSEDCTYSKILKELQDGLDEAAQRWGLEILEVGLTDLAEHKIFRVMTHDAPVILPIE